ncbi:MAG: hypothetical protein V4459_00915 [Pseudomonadota bacterium]
MATKQTPQSYDELIAAIDLEIAAHRAITREHQARITALDAEQATFGRHPNYAAYCHGGVAAVRAMGAAHIFAHIGFYLLPYRDAIDRLAAAREAADDDCLIVALRETCESDALLQVAGFAWADEQGLLKRGTIDPFWLKRPLLGLGQPAKAHGLAPQHAPAHRGLYTLPPAELLERFEGVATSSHDNFGDLLHAVIDAGGPELATLGREATERDAAERYEADCAGFAAHQRANGDRHWRWKPPFSRQGHLAVTTASVRGVDMPAERTRGHAATWLDDHGANPRFRDGEVS